MFLNPAEPDALKFLKPLLYRQQAPANSTQEEFVLAWTAIQMVHSDGFELLLEQGLPLETFASALVTVGLGGAGLVVRKVRSLVPNDLTDDNSGAFWSAIADNFYCLKQLAEEFWDACAESDESLRLFVGNNHAAFAESIPGG